MVDTQSVWKKRREVNEGMRKEEKEEEGEERKKFQKYVSRVYNLQNQRIQMPNHHGIGLSLKWGVQEPIKYTLQMEKLTGPNLHNQKAVESKFNLTISKDCAELLFHNNLTTYLPMVSSSFTGLYLFNVCLVAQPVKNTPAMQETQVQSLGQEDPLEQWLPTSVFLPGDCHGQRNLVGSIQSMGLQRVRHD